MTGIADILVCLRCESCWGLLGDIEPADLPGAGAGPWTGTLTVAACNRCTVRRARRWWEDGEAGRHLSMRLEWAALMPVVRKAWLTGKQQDVKVRVPTSPSDDIG